ncbi:Response regulator receiver modulated diguanylate cyclase/phosphodiesterase [Acidithiobacillus ferrivorans]|uniref:Response regulator receiver modulated diguanylate cyclase/phosphodiesterase n=1 Tax=Acidithiobacillus ferrivorans TaxID=160808 RepID=A0A060UKF5_9PROT|nr:EAL domain-containing protein [Acidithiobacillus ferrivorans]CDQ08856.1 Response regulator receiver modulated diguanylate cyclase/phosphodiesterase [Acidithiobacillus ferrivorans]SMH64225.1 Response regulator receiver modulated diguanylate cyclase/phosphodiesterase [Acidithiobacillus ferrivorans]
MPSASDIFNASLLIVDDKEANVLLLERMLRGAGYASVASTTVSHAVCELHRKNRYDLILLDLQMPSMDGFQVMECLKAIELDGYLPVLVITAQPEHQLRALQAGAKDFISKPFDLPEVLMRIHNMLEVRLLHRESKHHCRRLEETVQELRTAESGLRTTKAALSKEKAALDEHVLQLQRANEHLVVATIKAHELADQIQVARDQIDYTAQHDALTGLPNRLLLQDRLGQAIEVARRQERPLAVMFLDLDRFKYVNDSLGHAVGDQLLQSVAQRLKSGLRHSDTISRQGGDEFIVLLPNIEHAEDAALSAGKILAALTPPHRIGEHEFHISVSIGISIYPDDGQDTEILLKSADAAMYYAKENGRNAYKFFEPEMNARVVRRQSIETELRRALERQEFVLHYQPVIHLLSGKTVGVEALIRWQHPEHGILLPDEFVPIAEECGLILPMGRWVLREACSQAQTWIQAGIPPLTVAINTSAFEFRGKNFVENIRATLAETGLAPHLLELEMTETVLMSDSASTNSVLNALVDMGIKLAIDDFGTGYSSLTYLRQYPVDALKIDQSFVRQMTSSTDSTSIVDAVINLGINLKKRTVAEGIETAEQHALLLALHCDEGQGYYFSPPVPAGEFAALLQSGILPLSEHQHRSTI